MSRVSAGVRLGWKAGEGAQRQVAGVSGKGKGRENKTTLSREGSISRSTQGQGDVLWRGPSLVGCECVKKSTNCQDFTFQSATSNLCLQQQIAFESRVYLSLHGEMAKSRLLSYSLGGNLINHATWD